MEHVLALLFCWGSAYAQEQKIPLSKYQAYQETLPLYQQVLLILLATGFEFTC